MELRIHCYYGREFDLNVSLEEFSKLYGIKLILSSVGHSQSNVCLQQFHTLLEMSRNHKCQFSDEHTINLLAYAVTAYNHSVNRQTSLE